MSIKIFICLNFSSVCQSISWLTSLLILCHYRDISSSGLDMSLIFFRTIPRMFLNNFKIIRYTCMSVSLLVGLLPSWSDTYIGICPVLDDISFWNLWERFLGCSALVPNDSEFFVCLSVYQLAYSLTEIRQIYGYLKFWMRYLYDFFWDISGMLVHYFQIYLNFLYVSQSVSWLTSLLILDKYRDISSSGWDIFLNFFRHSWYVPTLITNYSELFVCLSVG